jgi:cytochrome b6-f complex iron-sulfur subunit
MSALTNFFKALAGICQTEPLDEDLWSFGQNRARVKVGQAPELKNPGGAVYLKGKGLQKPVLIVALDGGEYLCVLNRCTHFYRKLDPVPGEQKLRCCSVNHSTFDHEGNKLSGPARKPLTVYQWKLEDGELVIDISG